MTNLEKYPNTADAVKVWNGYNSGRDEPVDFKDWLNLVYIDSSSLLDVAKKVRRWIRDEVFLGPAGRSVLKDLNAAIAAEEARPKRNYERFATADEAYDALMEMCDTMWCKSCRFSNGDNLKASRNYNCAIHWLYSDRLDLAKDGGAKRAGRAEEKTEEASDGE